MRQHLGRPHLRATQEALRRLREGDRRFVADVGGHETLTNEARRRRQGLGDLFVIRVAGNIVDPLV
jgi:hypothetical protein